MAEQSMKSRKAAKFTPGQRIQRVLMVSCAVVLFALGVLLLLEPLTAKSAEQGKVVDNVGGAAAANPSRGRA
jgi:hypothetical protein